MNNIEILEDITITSFNCSNIYLNLEKVNKAIENLIQENKELKKENLEIRDWKYVIDTYQDLDKLKQLDLIKINGKEYISKDKIKEKIKELRDEFKYLGEDNKRVNKMTIETLQELLKE